MKNTVSQSHRGIARARFRASPVAAACCLLMAAGVVDAQQAATDAQTVTVTGIRRSIENSIAAKRNSDSITENITAEDLGKLPDASIAESLARLPGLTGQRGADGRVNVISIRGLSPAFSGALLNGREIVSSNDGRAVEYDQFPSELIGGATVYKTPNATLIGQGLSGTVNLLARRPLDTVGREFAINVRGETNSNDTQVPGVASPVGKRLSASYVNQFANNTIGLAVGFAHLESITQLRLTELDQYGDFAVFGLPVNGIPDSLFTPSPELLRQTQQRRLAADVLDGFPVNQEEHPRRPDGRAGVQAEQGSSQPGGSVLLQVRHP